jgi:cellulose synthase/poly-beta-1,6-N-acetylglucosamine synthase-like glycosyltransferase
MEVRIEPAHLILFWKILFCAAAAAQAFYLFWIMGRIAFFRSRKSEAELPPVSVIIAARNEEENLTRHLSGILEQAYPQFEVVVVNDASWDDSITVLRAYEKLYSNLKVVNVHPNDHHDGGKKLAITLGVKAAKYDRLLFTDADCLPRSNQWIASMMGALRTEEDLILGYSAYRKSPGFLNLLIRFDAYAVAMNYLGFALAGIPYMGVGRNLSYSKSSFFAVGGFRSHYKIPSGDDDLFVNQIANRNNTGICLELDSHVESLPEESWKAFWRQKRRHLTTGVKYRFWHKVLLVAQPLSLFAFLLAGIVLLGYSTWLVGVAIVFVLRFLIQIFIFRRSSRWLGQGDLAILAPVLEIIGMFFVTAIHLANASSKKVKWKT